MATYEEQSTNEFGQTIRRTLTDQEAIALFAPQAALSANKTNITADGVDFALITIQLKSVPLSNNQQQNLALVHKVILAIDETSVELTTDGNGQATHEIAATDAGTYSVRTTNLASNALTITAT